MSDTAVKYAEARGSGSFASARMAPFLVWPVARREVYLAICVSMLPTLTWGAIAFGWRALAGTFAMVLGALALHLLLRRVTYRGKRLLVAHTVGSALILACLSAPTWPAWLMLVCGVAVVILIFIWGGPGRERIGSAMFVAIALLMIAPRVLLHPATEPGEPLYGDRILARNRLFMGDLGSTASPAHGYAKWHPSRELGGNDAMMMYRPAMVANGLLDLLSVTAADAIERGEKIQWKEPGIEGPLVLKLPALEWVVTGMAPGMIGCVSGLAIVLGGLYLTYRNILRPKSCFLFLAAFILGLVAMAVSLDVAGQIGLPGVARTWRASSDCLITLLAYSFFGSDALFAAVFLLAWPGTEPITPRGRFVFLVIAGLAAAALHRYSPLPVPAATLSLTAMQPLTGVFDRVFRHWSWLNR